MESIKGFFLKTEHLSCSSLCKHAGSLCPSALEGGQKVQLGNKCKDLTGFQQMSVQTLPGKGGRSLAMFKVKVNSRNSFWHLSWPEICDSLIKKEMIDGWAFLSSFY